MHLDEQWSVNQKTKMSVSGPGWFVNPDDDLQLRWWSGEAWTEHKQPKPPDREPEAPPYVPMGSYYASATATVAPKLKRGEKDRQIRRNNSFAYTGYAFCLLSFLFNPFAVLSILAIVFSAIGLAKSNDLEGRGKVTGHGTALAGVILGLIGLAYFGWALSRQLTRG